jgi:hypothetical protein
MVKNMAKLLKQFLSNNTVLRHIKSISEDIKEQLLTRIKCSPKLALQTDKSTDVAGLAQLLVFVRYCLKKKHPGRVYVLSNTLERCTGSDLVFSFSRQ